MTSAPQSGPPGWALTYSLEADPMEEVEKWRRDSPSYWC
jgi:hypothetical protein